ncbi:MAG: DUF1553 domain-containing protein [Acidobacteriaceae bacterium]|nr:DUF1553 domain-containing protein [Acidobacteriaceae bacterium]
MGAALAAGGVQAQVPSAPAVSPGFESSAAIVGQNHIDELLFVQWKQLGIQPARLSSDAVFVRRAYLDVIGTLPTAQEARDFLQSTNPHKRSDLIDALLEREEFADYWALRWSDTLRIKAEFPINLWPNAAQSYHHWVRESLHEDKPYDQFARELLTASGSDFRVAPVNFYRAMQNKDQQTIAQTVALTFMGTRAENWPPPQLAQLAVFFSHVGYKSTREWKEEIVFFDAAGDAGAVKRTPAQLTAISLPRSAVLPDGKSVQLEADSDPRVVFANWLTSPANPWFSKAAVNRVWFWLMGRALTGDPDEINGGAPENAALLDYLSQELVRNHYSLKLIYREILTSETYQLSSLPRDRVARSREHFASYASRRLDAEVLIDALCQITGTSEDYSSAIPEPYTFMPVGQRAISLPDGSITSAFLEQFGKPSRDTGLQSERNNSFTAAQRLQLLNSSQIQKKLQGDAMQQMVRNAKNSDELITSLYLTILSRTPSPEERAVALKRFQQGAQRDAAVDVAWALINSTEFLYRH